jgi:2-C-methyl-D-erythritol 4-phosphate cytidylyltransferase
VWSVQTPQVFRYEKIREAYDRIQDADRSGITDDAMVLERMDGETVQMYQGEYTNIKITTPEDLSIAEEFMRKAGRM